MQKHNLLLGYGRTYKPKMIRAYLNNILLAPEHFIKNSFSSFFIPFLFVSSLTSSLNWVARLSGNYKLCIVYPGFRIHNDTRVYSMGLILIQSFNFRFGRRLDDKTPELHRMVLQSCGMNFMCGINVLHLSLWLWLVLEN